MHKQKGAVLVSSMILLLILTTIGLSSIQSTEVNIKVTSNVQDQGVAFQLAESVLQEAEQLVIDNSPNSNLDLGGYTAANFTASIAGAGAYLITDDLSVNQNDNSAFLTLSNDRFRTLNANNAFASVSTSAANVSNNTSSGFYIIAYEQNTSGGNDQIIVTAFGAGLTAGSQIVVQSTLQ